MPVFSVRYKQRGKIYNMDVKAGSSDAARRQVARYGAVVEVRRKQRGGGAKMSQADRYTFLMRMSTMLASRVGTTEALRLLRDSFSGPISACAGGLLDRVQAGIDLPTAIVEDKRNFPGAIGLIIKVGASTGQAYKALQDAAEFEYQLKQVREGSGKGIMSGVMGFFVAGGLMIASTFYISPEIMKMQLISAQKGKVDIDWVNDVAFWTTMLICIAMVGMALMFFTATIGRRIFPVLADNIILRIPYYRDIVLSQDNYVALRRLSLMITSGVRVEEALATSVDATRKGLLRRDLEHALDALRKGQKWSQAMSTLHPTDRAALALAADRTQIGTNLDNIANQYRSMYIQRISTVGPALMTLSAVSVSLAGGVLFGQTILPMLQVSAKMLE